MKRVEAIKKFFEGEGKEPWNLPAATVFARSVGRKVENKEILSLSKEEREEIGGLCAAALGVEIEA